MRVAPGKIDQIGSESHHNDPKTTLSRANKFRGPYSVGSFARGSAVRIQQKAEADEDTARPGAGIFARSQVGGGGRSGRECEQSNGQPSRRPPRMDAICHIFSL